MGQFQAARRKAVQAPRLGKSLARHQRRDPADMRWRQLPVARCERTASGRLAGDANRNGEAVAQAMTRGFAHDARLSPREAAQQSLHFVPAERPACRARREQGGIVAVIAFGDENVAPALEIVHAEISPTGLKEGHALDDREPWEAELACGGLAATEQLAITVRAPGLLNIGIEVAKQHRGALLSTRALRARLSGAWFQPTRVQPPMIYLVLLGRPVGLCGWRRSVTAGRASIAPISSSSSETIEIDIRPDKR